MYISASDDPPSNRYLAPSVDEERMERAYRTEFDWFVRQLQSSAPDNEQFEIRTIFFGGGSPSLAPTSLIGRLINHFQSVVPFADHPEITLEANPTVGDCKGKGS